MPIKDSKQPIEWFSIMREGFDDLKTILVYFGRQDLLDLGLAFIILAAITRSGHYLFEHHTTSANGTIFQELVRLGNT